jgi:hypothetical protein
MGRQRGRDVLGGVSCWFGSHRRESRDNADRRRRDHGDQFWRRVATLRSHSPPPNRGGSSSEERRQLRSLWREKSQPQVPDAAVRNRDDPPLSVFDWWPERTTEVITIIPHQSSLEDHATQSSTGTTFADQEAHHPVQIIIQTNSEQPPFDAQMQHQAPMRASSIEQRRNLIAPEVPPQNQTGMSDTKSNTNSQTNHQEEKRSVETEQPPAMQQTQEVSQESNAVLNQSYPRGSADAAI